MSYLLKSLIAINRGELKFEKVQKFKLASINFNEIYNLFIWIKNTNK